MTIGALGAYNFQPYVYNTNSVSSASMNKLSRISDDVLDKKIDYSGLAEEESQNINPLRRGQTLDFQSMLEMQMQRGQNNAARIMRPAQDSREEQETVQTSNTNVPQFTLDSTPEQETAASASTAETANANSDNGNNNISYQMQQALNAYGMFMTA